MSVTVNGTNGLTFADGSTQATGFAPGMRNRIINGDMRIDQRNAGASGTATGYTVDRWSYNASQSSKGTWQQNAGAVTPPAGFSNYLGFTSSSAYSVAAGDYFVFQQIVEGFNVADLAWGTASAKTITLSFWVRSSLSGTFGGAVQNSGLGQSYPFSYSISSTNTWEQKSIIISGSTSSTWLSTNGAGLYLALSFGAGSTWSGVAGAWSTTPAFSVTGATSVVGTNGATFYITGVQLEKGSVATPFEYRQYGQELSLCQRYYWKPSINTFWLYPLDLTSGYRRNSFSYPVPMRAAPTCTAAGSTNGTFNATGIAISDITATNCSAQGDLTGSGYSWLTSLTASAEL